ncbi:MAG: transcriptional repressor [Sedimentisphaerales bacterium]|nr:transcriptional repressor [Sedimentisphaerales bacterium]
MIKENYTINSAELEKKTEWFIGKCREKGLKVTPQRLAIYRELMKTDEHPSAEMMYNKLRQDYPGISLDTVNRTLITLHEMGAANIVEGSGDSKRYDCNMDEHQHFKCIKCKKIYDFHHKPFDDIKLPPNINKKFKILRKTVYLEGICDICLEENE